MGRFWRERTGAVLALYLLLAVIGNVYVHVGSSFRPGLGIHAGFDTVGNAYAGSGTLWWAIIAFLVWRVWRGGGISWLVLFLPNLATAAAAGPVSVLTALPAAGSAPAPRRWARSRSPRGNAAPGSFVLGRRKEDRQWQMTAWWGSWTTSSPSVPIR